MRTGSNPVEGTNIQENIMEFNEADIDQMVEELDKALRKYSDTKTCVIEMLKQCCLFDRYTVEDNDMWHPMDIYKPDINDLECDFLIRRKSITKFYDGSTDTPSDYFIGKFTVDGDWRIIVKNDATDAENYGYALLRDKDWANWEFKLIK